MILLKRLVFVVSILCASVQGFSQSGNGAIKGKLTDGATGETLPFANVVVTRGGNTVAGGSTDFNGEYSIRAIPVGTYDIEATFVGYPSLKMTGVRISSGIMILDLKMTSGGGIKLDDVVIVAFEVPLIDKKGGSATVVDGEALKRMPGRGVESAATITGGVVSNDGQIESIRGARPNATVYYIDGIKVIGNLDLPQSAIDQVEIILGGLPPMYGDATGGIISVTTKGASSEFFASVEMFTRLAASDYWDIGGVNLFGGSVGGPLVQVVDKAKTAAAQAIKQDSIVKKPFISYFVSGQTYVDPNYGTSAFPNKRIKDDVLAELIDNPLVLQKNGTAISAEYLRASDMEEVNKAMSQDFAVNVSGKIDINTSKSTTITFGVQVFLSL